MLGKEISILEGSILYIFEIKRYIKKQEGLHNVRIQDLDLAIAKVFFILWIAITFVMLMGFVTGTSHSVLEIGWYATIIIALVFFGFAIFIPKSDAKVMRHRELYDPEYNIGEREVARICPHCISPLSRHDTEFCPSCGTSFPSRQYGSSDYDAEDSINERDMAAICPHCVSPLSNRDSLFCPKCGGKIDTRKFRR